MHLNPELARKIVQKTMDILGKNINIMNQKGIIIASGDQTRIDTFHEVAAEVIEKGTIIIKKEEAEEYQGVKPGINLPIKFNEEIIGVVGITGQANEVEGYGKIVKNMAELILQQELLFKEINRKNKVKENFYQQLLSNDIQSKELLKDRANLLNIKYKLPRVAVVIRLNPDDNEIITKKIQRIFSSSYQAEGDMLLIRGENLVLIKSLVNEQQKEQEKEIKEVITEIKKKARQKIPSFIIGVGQVFKELDKLYLSYQGAKHALEVGNTVYRQEEEKQVFYLNRLGYDYFLPFIPEESVNYYLHNLFNHNIAHIFSETNIGEIIEALFNNNLNVSQTAQELCIHRNTLLYKLENIKEKTGINPKKARGLFMLLFAHHLYLYKN